MIDINGGKNFVFIDASNIWEAQKAKGRFFDYDKLRKFINDSFKCDSVKVHYYSAYPADGTRNYNLDGKHKFFTFLRKGLGFVVRKKKLKRIRVESEEGEHILEKGDMDVEITIDAMHHFGKYDTAILFTGDSDFLALVNYLKNNNKRVYVFSSQNNISKELISGSDGYFDLLKIKEDIWGKELRYRESKK